MESKMVEDGSIPYKLQKQRVKYYYAIKRPHAPFRLSQTGYATICH